MPDPYDVLTIAAIVDELSRTIGDGRIQRIGLVDSRTIGAEIYAAGRRHYLLASADDRRPRLHLAPEMPSLDPELVTPFGLLLRKHARGGIILAIDQPTLERLVRLSIARRQMPLKTVDEAIEPLHEDDEPESRSADDEAWRQFTLYVELMGRRSNLILVDDEGRIMDSAKRVTAAMSRVRPILPRMTYLPPPLPDRLDPRTIGPPEAQRFLAGLPPNADLARSLVAAYRGISPTMAHEIVYRLTGQTDVLAGDLRPERGAALAQETLAMLAPLRSNQWNPQIYRVRRGDERADTGAVVTFSPMSMAHLAAEYDEIAVESISQAAAMVEDAGIGDRSGPARHVQRRQRLLDAVAAARGKAERRLAALASEAIRAAEAERLKTSGEMIYAYLWQVAPGQTELVVDTLTIPLDPDLSPNENAQAYFERYRKAQAASAQLPALAQESRDEIVYLDQLSTLIAQAPGFSELEALAAEWLEQFTEAPAPGSRPKRKATPRRPRPLRDAEGNSVYVGHSGPQNDLLTFEIAGPDDTWLHARGVGGSHVIVRWRNPEQQNAGTVAAAASLAAWYSAARESGGVEVDVAPRRFVRKIKGARPGMVTYRNERTIRVQPAPEGELRHVLDAAP